MHIRQVEGIGDRLEEDIRNILNRAGIYFRIFSRAKTPFSIAQKLEKPGYGFGEHDKKMQDLIGLRVVVYYQDDMDIVRTILEKTFRQVGEWSKTDNTEEEFKASKLNGVFWVPEEYQRVYNGDISFLPIDATFEVQLRTISFEGWHEIEHDMRYKSPYGDDFWREDLSRTLNSVLANLELCDWTTLNVFEKLADPDDQIAQQFALRSRVLLGRLDGRYTPLEQIDLLMQAIQLTVPRFDLESIESFLYTRDEITIINQIGLAYSDAGQNKKAAEIYYQLLKYVRKHFKETITSIGVLPLVLYNYARVLDLCGRYEEGAALAKEGREACIQYGHYQVLPRCLEIEAECRHFMGDDEISKELYYQSYYLCKVIEYQVGLEIVKKEAKEYLDLTLS